MKTRLTVFILILLLWIESTFALKKYNLINTFYFKKTDITSNIKKVLLDYAKLLDVPIFFNESFKLISVPDSENAQELIELAKILDVEPRCVILSIDLIHTNSNDKLTFGFDWFGVYNKYTFSNFGFKAIGAQLTDFPIPTGSVNPQNTNLYVNPENFNINTFFNKIDVGSGLILPITFGGIDLNTKRLSALIHAFQQLDKVRIIEQTKIICKNLCKAEFESTFSLGIYGLENKMDSLSQVAQVYGIQYKNAGIILQITPRIINYDQIELELFFQKTILLDNSVIRVSVPNQIGQIIVNPPIYNVFRLYEKVILNKGESIILSSAFQKNDQTFLRKIPFLDSLPIIKKLSSSKYERSESYEEFLLMTPDF